MTHDNVCAPKTDCIALVVGQYVKKPAVDSISSDVLGTDNECANHTICTTLPGYYTYKRGDKFNDAECRACPAGTQWHYGMGCKQCIFGVEYSAENASTSCTACTNCSALSPGDPKLQPCPPGQTCRQVFFLALLCSVT